MNASRELYLQALKRSLGVPSVIIERIEMEFEEGYTSAIEVVYGHAGTRECIGIHISKPTPCELDNSIEQAMSQGFERIYIYR